MDSLDTIRGVLDQLTGMPDGSGAFVVANGISPATLLAPPGAENADTIARSVLEALARHFPVLRNPVALALAVHYPRIGGSAGGSSDCFNVARGVAFSPYVQTAPDYFPPADVQHMAREVGARMEWDVIDDRAESEALALEVLESMSGARCAGSSRFVKLGRDAERASVIGISGGWKGSKAARRAADAKVSATGEGTNYVAKTRADRKRWDVKQCARILDILEGGETNPLALQALAIARSVLAMTAELVA